jgi:hypothetical protein
VNHGLVDMWRADLEYALRHCRRWQLVRRLRYWLVLRKLRAHYG